MQGARLHTDLYLLVKRSTTGERAILIGLVAINMTLGPLAIFMLGDIESPNLAAIVLLMIAVASLIGAMVMIPIARASRAARLAKLIVLLENAKFCAACGVSLADACAVERCPNCHRLSEEALWSNLERSLRLVASGVRPQLVRVWARLARESGHSGVDQLIADVRLPRRPFRISYLLASALSISMIVLVFALMGVSEAASRAVAMAAIPVVVVSFLAAFLTSRAAGPELIGPLLFDGEVSQSQE